MLRGSRKMLVVLSLGALVVLGYGFSRHSASVSPYTEQTPIPRVDDNTEPTTAPSDDIPDTPIDEIPDTPVPYTEMKITRDIAYGASNAEKFDLYLPAPSASPNTKFPVIFMVHGGGWVIGDKENKRVIENKIAYLLPRGYAFISINYPLNDGDPEIEVEAVARAVAYVQSNAQELQIDPARIVLMGHSAGGHLISLLASSQDIRENANVMPWLGTISLDSAGYDIVAQMNDNPTRVYKRAFGTDPDFWERMSPTHQYSKKVEPFLLVCSSSRIDGSCEQADDFQQKIQSVGGQAQVLPVPYTHELINENVGLPGSYTESIQKFLTTLSLP